MPRIMTQFVLAIASVFAILASADASASSIPNNAGAELVNAIPLALRNPAVKPAMFRVTTTRAVTPAEYERLGAADRGAIVVFEGYKVSAVADVVHRLAIVERSCCGLQEWIVFSPAAPLAEKATRVKLDDVSIGGVRVGSSASLVERQFGRVGNGSAGPNVSLLRYRHARTHDCSTFYTFAVERGKVRAISVKNAC
jgi:hypothetical protein